MYRLYHDREFPPTRRFLSGIGVPSYKKIFIGNRSSLLQEDFYRESEFPPTRRLLSGIRVPSYRKTSYRESEFPPTRRLLSGIRVPSYRKTSYRESEFPPTRRLLIGNRSSLLQEEGVIPFLNIMYHFRWRFCRSDLESTPNALLAFVQINAACAKSTV